MNQNEQRKTKVNVINPRKYSFRRTTFSSSLCLSQGMYSFGWVRRFRGIRRWASQDMPAVQTPGELKAFGNFIDVFFRLVVLQRYSVPVKTTAMNNQEQIISVKNLAESFYTDEINRPRTKTFTSQLEYENKPAPIQYVWMSFD